MRGLEPNGIPDGAIAALLHEGIFDTSLMTACNVMLIGAGRSVGSARLLAAAGLKKLTAIDHGFVDLTVPASVTIDDTTPP